jgi:hypothetical protein
MRHPKRVTALQPTQESASVDPRFLAERWRPDSGLEPDRRLVGHMIEYDVGSDIAQARSGPRATAGTLARNPAMKVPCAERPSNVMSVPSLWRSRTAGTRYPCHVTGDDDVERASWEHRSAEFGRLREYDDGRSIVVAEFEPVADQSAGEWNSLRWPWLVLPPHPHVLEAMTATDHGLLVRYPALDWSWRPVDLTSDPDALRIVALWGAQLAAALAHVWKSVKPSEAAHFLRPSVKFDLVGDARAAFLPIAASDPDLPDDARDRWPQCDERAAVYVVGNTVLRWCTGLTAGGAAQLAAIVTR